ncbi:MFS transporter [Chromobacterium paludis]|uniref:hypothetical protein n=1 Tax=Chromobacterium paludis TaxID=2605945 RepID=UPI0018C898C7|nr:hypothetical protein [Chromobacterium paludis]
MAFCPLKPPIFVHTEMGWGKIDVFFNGLIGERGPIACARLDMQPQLAFHSVSPAFHSRAAPPIHKRVLILMPTVMILSEQRHERRIQRHPLPNPAGTVLTQFALGSVYTWSLFNVQLSHKLSEPISQVAIAFGLMLGLGVYLTSQANNLIMLYLCAGLLVGFADGAGYLKSLSNCVKWFPERKSLISACVLGAYSWAARASSSSTWRCSRASALRQPSSCGA